ncbi:hypothetical protein LJR189_004653 [Acidovorax delafieldii]
MLKTIFLGNQRNANGDIGTKSTYIDACGPISACIGHISAFAFA